MRKVKYYQSLANEGVAREMAFKIKFGKSTGKKHSHSKLWSIARAILSGIFLTLAILLVLLAIAELWVAFLDRTVQDNTFYYDWGRAPLIIFLASIPFFIIWIVLNLDRFKFTKFLTKKFKTSKPPEKIETIDLD
jgi:hypothetical protein